MDILSQYLSEGLPVKNDSHSLKYSKRHTEAIRAPLLFAALCTALNMASCADYGMAFTMTSLNAGLAPKTVSKTAQTPRASARPLR